MGGRGTPATLALDRAGIAFVLHSYEHDPRTGSYGGEAAAELGADPARVFKTLVVTVDGRLTVGVVPVSASLDYKALAAALGGKRAALADPAVAVRSTGYVLGGISPLGQRTQLITYLDASAAAHQTIFVSGGRRGLEIELSPADLLQLTAGRLAAISAVRSGT
jgi:Cys-tRNA(Pro)/Cys-tRNA(Cys) deacylase